MTTFSNEISIVVPMIEFKNLHQELFNYVSSARQVLFIDLAHYYNHRYERCYRLDILSEKEAYQIDCLARGVAGPREGRFRNMVPVATLLRPYLVTTPLLGMSNDYLSKLLGSIFDWIYENFDSPWSFHVGQDVVTIFVSSEEEASLIGLNLL